MGNNDFRLPSSPIQEARCSGTYCRPTPTTSCTASHTTCSHLQLGRQLHSACDSFPPQVPATLCCSTWGLSHSPGLALMPRTTQKHGQINSSGRQPSTNRKQQLVDSPLPPCIVMDGPVTAPRAFSGTLSGIGCTAHSSNSLAFLSSLSYFLYSFTLLPGITSQIK